VEIASDSDDDEQEIPGTPPSNLAQKTVTVTPRALGVKPLEMISQKKEGTDPVKLRPREGVTTLVDTPKDDDGEEEEVVTGVGQKVRPMADAVGTNKPSIGGVWRLPQGARLLRKDRSRSPLVRLVLRAKISGSYKYQGAGVQEEASRGWPVTS